MAKQTKRIRTRRAVAKHFGVTERAVGYWQNESWWQPDFRTAAGYDVAAIDAARKANARPDKLTEARHQLRLHREKAELDLKLADLRAKERREQLELGNLLPADVYAEYQREVLGMIRASLEELPKRVAREVPRKVLPYVYRDMKRTRAKNAKPSPLQRHCDKLLADIEAWLTGDPVEETKR